jgi:hypothetical protein
MIGWQEGATMYVTAKTPREHCRLEQTDDNQWRAYHTGQGMVIDAPEQQWSDERTALHALHEAKWVLVAITTPPGKSMPDRVYARYLPEEMATKA